MSTRPRIAFSWSGLPQYAAWLMREAIARIGTPCPVVGTRPSVPIEDMEQALGQPVIWLDRESEPRWSDLGLEPPEVFLQSGWATPAFSALGRDVRRAGGAVIGLADFSWRGDFRQRVLGPLAFRSLYRNHFSGMIVPGKSGTRVARHLGVPADRIRTGLYGASPDIFGGGPPLAERPCRFLFVGRMVEMKGLRSLLEAFRRIAPAHPQAELHLCGCGPLAEAVPRHPQIVLEDFVQPQALAERYRRARALVLPSLREPWGLVVHEAALSGCALVLSEAVGSGDDLAGPANALRVPPGDAVALADALAQVARWEDGRLRDAEAESRALAARFGPNAFAEAVLDLASTLRPVPA